MADPTADINCVPDVEIKEVIVSVPGDLTQANPLPPVPSTGDNAALLDWAQGCAATNIQYETQMSKIRELK